MNNSYAASNCKIPMFLLAVFPILDYYYFGTSNFTFANVISIFLFLYTLLKGKFSFKNVPKSYYIYWIYSALQIYLIAGIGGWSDYIPGGVMLAIFSLCTFCYATYFDINVLRKYMRWVFIVASTLWFFQNMVWLSAHVKISTFLPLTNSILSNHMTYKELTLWQNEVGGEFIERFSSIFSEPSHFAQYALLLLAVELFIGENRNKLYTKFSVIIAAMLVLLQSGAGLIGMGFLAIIKIVYILLVTKQKKYYFYIVLLVPMFVIGIQWYLNSQAGAYVAERSEQFDYTNETSTSSGFVRMYFGWYRYGELSPVQKLLGTSRAAIGEMREGGFFNGVTNVLCAQGLIGLFLLIVFYAKTCKRREPYSSVASLYMLFISLIASTYLGGLMLISAAIALGVHWKAKKESKFLISNYQ